MLSVDIEKRFESFYLKTKFETDQEITGILGASGCGKSLTLRCIAGVETPDRGRIILNGVTLFDSEKKINLPPQQRGVGYLFQNYALFPNMSVEKNILCGLHHEKNERIRRQKLADILKLLNLNGYEKHRINQISGGQQQRVALARILVNGPRLLLLDEPFSALDTYLRERLQIEIKKLLVQYQVPVLIVTHSRNEAYQMCRKIAIMHTGKIHAFKPVKELFADPGTVIGAEITGCKNIAKARKAGDYEVEVPAWGIHLQTKQEVRDDIEAVGIRAHYYSPKTEVNRLSVQQTNEMEEPFEWIIQFRYINQRKDTPDLWWRLPKDRKPPKSVSELGVLPVNVVLLYPSKSDQMTEREARE